MKLLYAMTISLVLAVGAGAVVAQDFQKGFAAYQSGDYATALREWGTLAEQGDSSAQFNLGLMYRNGKGVLQDNVRAHMWYNIAAANGSKKSGEWRDEIAGLMTSADISEAQKMARECMNSNYQNCGW